MRNSRSSNTSTYYGWYVVATCFFIALLTVGSRNAFGIFVIPMSEEFGWNRTTISLAAGLGFLVNGLTQPFIGHLFDRLGGRRVIIVGLVIMGLATFALSFTFHILFLVFVFGFVLSTALSGPSLTNTMALLSKWFRRRRATVVALNSAGTSVGGFLLVPLAMFLLQATSWRVTWAVLGLAILVLAVPLSYMFIRDDPAELGLQPDGDTERPEDSQEEVDARRRGSYEVDRWQESLQSPPIWQLSAAYVVCGITTGIISTHFVPFAIDRGVSPTMAATIFGAMMALNLVGGIGAGMLSDRFRRKNILGFVYLVRGLAFIALLIFPSSWGLWAFAVLAGFSWVASVPLTASLTADVYGLRALGTITGISFLCHQIGSFAMILLAGVLYDLTGSYTLPFAIAGAFLFPAALVSFSIREDKYSGRYSTQPLAAAGSGH
ncbi:MAG: MFS transporter [Chloroflexi bacterium]|nr:MFS transporter [Chloroflexota bacterium]